MAQTLLQFAPNNLSLLIMKKTSIILAFLGLFSANCFSFAFPTQSKVTQDGKKQTTEKNMAPAPKKETSAPVLKNEAPAPAPKKNKPLKRVATVKKEAKAVSIEQKKK